MKNVRMSRLGRLLRGWNKQFFSLSSPRNCRRGAFGDLPLCKRLTRTNNRFPSPAGRTLAGRQTLGAANTSYAVARGFTLIELLVVVLIIGILASVAMPQYTKAVEKSRAAGVIQKVKSLQNAVDMYLLANDWPTVQFTNLSGTSGRENLDISFKANAIMKRSGLAVSSYMVFDDYYFYVMCEPDVCYIIAEDNKPYKEQIVRASWYRYKNYTRYQPMDTWNRGTCKYKSDSSAGKAICEYFKQNSLLSNNNWEISAKS